MKMKITLAALAAALLLAGCGNTDSSNKADNISPAPAQAENSAAEISAAESTAEESNAEAQPAESVTDTAESTGDELDPDAGTEIDAAAYEALKASIDGSYEFEVQGEKTTFTALLKQGLANVTGDGRAFALTLASGGAGNLFYDVNYTADGGKTWNKSGTPFSILNGTVSSIALEDGRLLIIDHAGVSFDEQPVVYTAEFTDSNELNCTENREWFSGLDFDSTQPFNAYAEYLGGYNIKLTVKQLADASESETAVFDREISLLPDTLVPGASMVR